MWIKSHQSGITRNFLKTLKNVWSAATGLEEEVRENLQRSSAPLIVRLYTRRVKNLTISSNEMEKTNYVQFVVRIFIHILPRKAISFVLGNVITNQLLGKIQKKNTGTGKVESKPSTKDYEILGDTHDGEEGYSREINIPAKSVERLVANWKHITSNHGATFQSFGSKLPMG